MLDLDLLGDPLSTSVLERDHPYPHPSTGETKGVRFWIDARCLPVAKPVEGKPAPAPDTGIGCAACVGLDTAVFFSEQTDDVDFARKTCEECPARIQCLDYALLAGREGIWAGLNHKQRQHLLRKMERIKAARLAGSEEAADRLQATLREELTHLGFPFE